MTTLHYVKKARKRHGKGLVKKGDPYFWWKFKRFPKQISKTKPRRSQLTRSEFLGAMMDAEDSISEVEEGNFAALADACSAAAEAVQEQGEACKEKYDNMPPSLQEGDTGQLLLARSEACENIASSLEDVANLTSNLSTEVVESDNEDEEERDLWAEAMSEVEGIDWSYE